MNVIDKVSCYLERSVVSLKLRKQYLNSVTHNTSSLLWIKSWTVWYIERYSMSTYTGVTNCQKQSIFWPTLYINSTFGGKFVTGNGFSDPNFLQDKNISALSQHLMAF